MATLVIPNTYTHCYTVTKKEKFLEQDRGNSYLICVNQQLIRGTLNNTQEVDRLSTLELFFVNHMSTFAPPNCTKFILMAGAHACAGVRVCVCVCV